MQHDDDFIQDAERDTTRSYSEAAQKRMREILHTGSIPTIQAKNLAENE